MKRCLAFLLFFCLMLSGCGNENLVKVSSFWNEKAIVDEGDAVGFGPLDEEEVVMLHLENKGTSPAELALLVISETDEEESLYKSIRLGEGERRMLRLKKAYGSEGQSLAYRIKFIHGAEAKIFLKVDSYLPEGMNYRLPEELEEDNLLQRIESLVISEKESEKKIPFELEDSVAYFSIAYEGKEKSQTEVSFYRTSDNQLIMSGKALPSIRFNSENSFTLNDQNEAFYVVLKELEDKPLEGELLFSFDYEG